MSLRRKEKAVTKCSFKFSSPVKLRNEQRALKRDVRCAFGVLSERGGFQAWFWRTAGGKREEVLSGKLEDVIWFSQQQELQEVRYEGSDLWMLSQVRGVIRLQLLLPQRDINTHSYSALLKGFIG